MCAGEATCESKSAGAEAGVECAVVGAGMNRGVGEGVIPGTTDAPADKSDDLEPSIDRQHEGAAAVSLLEEGNDNTKCLVTTNQPDNCRDRRSHSPHTGSSQGRFSPF